MNFWNVFFMSLLYLVACGQSARILGIFQQPMTSHFAVFQVLMEGLAERGHNVTVVSHFPHQNPPKGYNDISLAGLLGNFTSVFPFEWFENPPSELIRPYFQTSRLIEIGLENCRKILPSPPIQRLLQAKGEYDLVIVEQFLTDCFLTIPYKLEVPYIGFSSCAMLPWLNTRFRNPTDASFVNNIFTGRGSKMGLIDRILNTYVNVLTTSIYYAWFQPPAQEIVNKYVSNVPPLEALARNTSLILVNSHFSLLQSKPFQPAVVEVGGIHIKPPKPLPAELAKFVEEAEHGVILFSMGSILNSTTMSQARKTAFLNVFRSLPQRVVWKIGGEIENLPPNVLTGNWLPQRDILAHGNVRAFISHGGLLGTTEAIASGTPFVGIPMFGDQHSNVGSAVQIGLAIELPINSITEKSIRKALETVLSEEYYTRAKQLGREFLDRPLPPLQLAIYWVEYVLRHGGGPLRSSAVDLDTIQYYLLDVIVIFITVLLAIFYLIRKIIVSLNRLLFKGNKNVKKVKLN